MHETNEISPIKTPIFKLPELNVFFFKSLYSVLLCTQSIFKRTQKQTAIA